jgi:hypothetical protein
MLRHRHPWPGCRVKGCLAKYAASIAMTTACSTITAVEQVRLVAFDEPPTIYFIAALQE